MSFGARLVPIHAKALVLSHQPRGGHGAPNTARASAQPFPGSSSCSRELLLLPSCLDAQLRSATRVQRRKLNPECPELSLKPCDLPAKSLNVTTENVYAVIETTLPFGAGHVVTLQT